jgi:hypothetical protein
MDRHRSHNCLSFNRAFRYNNQRFPELCTHQAACLTNNRYFSTCYHSPSSIFYVRDYALRSWLFRSCDAALRQILNIVMAANVLVKQFVYGF